jgi:hypothetical protein
MDRRQEQQNIWKYFSVPFVGRRRGERRDLTKRLDSKAETWWKEGYRYRLLVQFPYFPEDGLQFKTETDFLRYIGRKSK